MLSLSKASRTIPRITALGKHFSTSRSSMASFTIEDTVSLPATGNKIPRLGLGVFNARGSKCTDAIVAAVKSGYRHVDSAQFYHNEAETGEGVRKSGIARSEIFVTTKMMGPAGGVDETYAALKASVEKIGIDYVDLFLIHTPGSSSQGRRTLWKALEKLNSEGLAKDIGVSNYGVHHLKEMKDYAKVYPPAVNQIEVRCWMYVMKQDLLTLASFILGSNRRTSSRTASLKVSHLRLTAHL